MSVIPSVASISASMRGAANLILGTISKIYMKKFLAMRLNQMLLPAWKKAQEHQAREDGESRGFSR